MKYIAKANNKTIKKFWEINTGMNKLGVVWVLTIIVSSVIFAFGIVALLQDAIYDENTIFTLIGTYLIIRLLIFLFLKMLAYFKL